MSTSNQGTLSASDTLNSNASAQSAPSTPTATTISTLGNPLAAAVAMPVAVPVAVIESVSEPEFAPYMPVLVREGGHYYTNIWSPHYCPRSFDIWSPSSRYALLITLITLSSPFPITLRRYYQSLLNLFHVYLTPLVVISVLFSRSCWYGHFYILASHNLPSSTNRKSNFWWKLWCSKDPQTCDSQSRMDGLEWT
jgi:hypothetical protein